jgi:hypothetical protein
MCLACLPACLPAAFCAVWNPLSWAMEVAAILAIILLDYADFALVSATASTIL